MSDISAFPIPHLIADANDDNFKLGQSGMTLRDYFAAKALQGMLQNGNHIKIASELEVDRVFIDLPHTAYSLADAMLKAREQ
jgi:hypothetical protein